MAKVAKMTLPPAYDLLLAKILAHFNQSIYPTWATRNFHLTRAAVKVLKEKTVLPKVRDAWILLSAAQKLDWKNAAGYTGYNKYQLFTADYVYRRKNNLSLPGIPYTTHQLYGLKVANPGGSGNIRIRLHLKDLVGPLTISFNYKKVQYSVPAGLSFNFKAQAFKFDGGLNIVSEKEWISPTGNVAWASVSQIFGSTGIKYFHLTVEFKLDNYDADVFLDNLSISDAGGVFFSDSFNKKVGKEWIYQPFYRKQGWAFDPENAVPYFEVVYLD